MFLLRWLLLSTLLKVYSMSPTINVHREEILIGAYFVACLYIIDISREAYTRRREDENHRNKYEQLK